MAFLDTYFFGGGPPDPRQFGGENPPGRNLPPTSQHLPTALHHALKDKATWNIVNKPRNYF